MSMSRALVHTSSVERTAIAIFQTLLAKLRTHHQHLLSLITATLDLILLAPLLHDTDYTPTTQARKVMMHPKKLMIVLSLF
jgi:hypothetical protein